MFIHSFIPHIPPPSHRFDFPPCPLTLRFAFPAVAPPHPPSHPYIHSSTHSNYFLTTLRHSNIIAPFQSCMGGTSTRWPTMPIIGILHFSKGRVIIGTRPLIPGSSIHLKHSITPFHYYTQKYSFYNVQSFISLKWGTKSNVHAFQMHYRF